MAQPAALPEGYYLQNFETVLRDVLARYGDLLRPEEEARISGFLALPPPARRLLVRMFTRQGPWFRPDGFHYPEIEDIPGALATLCAQGFCATGAMAAPGDLVALLRKDELGDRLRGFGIAFPRTLSRAGLAELLSSRADPEALKTALLQSLHPVAPLDQDWVRLAFFLFFGNGDQDLTDFVLADTGRVRYEAYPIDPRDRLFQARVACHPPPEPLPELCLTVPRHPSRSVERAALEAAAQAGWAGFFTENGLWQGLFGLAFWDQLFAPLPGAFQHRFQAAPADIGGPDFHHRRREAIERRLEQLAAPGALATALLQVAECKRGISNAFVNWRRLTQDLLGTALEVLPAPVVLSVLSTMAPNPMAFRSGFPDLLLCRLDPPACMLWEVKGPGDTLRPEQERWLRHFNREGVEARIAWIAYG